MVFALLQVILSEEKNHSKGFSSEIISEMIRPPNVMIHSDSSHLWLIDTKWQEQTWGQTEQIIFLQLNSASTQAV